MNGDSKVYRTSDLQFSAYLKVAGVAHVDTEKKEGRTYFYFEQPEGGIRDLKNQYFNRQAKVVALDFADAMRSLKTLIHMADDED